jgi:hypothetical protein
VTGTPVGAGWRLLSLLPDALIILAEAAWVAVVYDLFQGASQEPSILGVPSLALFVGAGLVVGRWAPRRFGGRWSAVAVILVALAAALGWLASPETREALRTSDPSSALVVHPGGWLAGLAFFRGTAHSRSSSSEKSVGTLMAFGIPGIAVAFLLGGAIAEPGRTQFRDAALTATVVFVATGTLALALARIRQLGGSTGFDWRRNPAWIGMLLVLVAGILVVAIPASLALGPAVLLFVALLPVPLFVTGLTAGSGRTAWRKLGILFLAAVAIVILMRLGVGPPPSPPAPPGAIAGEQPSTDRAWIAVAAWAVFLIVMAAAIALLSALWMRQSLSRSGDDVAEERTIDVGATDAAARPGRRWLPRWRTRPPTNAIEAYLAAVRDLEDDAALRRHPDETPAEHARRLRALGAGVRFGAAVDLLAADYELARFGGEVLTPAEHRRALARWRRVRAQAARRAEDTPG